MYLNYQSKIIDTIKLKQLVEELKEICSDIPYLFAFATSNLGNGINGTTEYEICSQTASALHTSLYDDKLSKIESLYYGLPNFNQPAYTSIYPPKEFSVDRKFLRKQITQLYNFCFNCKIPMFVAVACFNSANEFGGNQYPSTDYLFDIVSPNLLQFDLYDNRITPPLRYTLDKSIYPDPDNIISGTIFDNLYQLN